MDLKEGDAGGVDGSGVGGIGCGSGGGGGSGGGVVEGGVVGYVFMVSRSNQVESKHENDNVEQLVADADGKS